MLKTGITTLTISLDNCLVNHILNTNLDTAVQLGVEATSTLILDGTDTIIHTVDEEDLRSDIPESILIVQPLDNGGGTILGQSGVPLTANPLCILSRIVVLAGSQTLDLDKSHDTTVNDVTDLGDCLGISELGDVAIVGIEGSIDISEADEFVGIIDIHILAYSAKSIVRVQTIVVCLLIVSTVEQLRPQGSVINSIAPSVEAIIDRSIIEASLLTERGHVISLETE